jgi:aminoglycoside 2''-phosphotransferase
MDKREAYIRNIQTAYPDFEVATATLNDQGQNNDVLVVNGAFIFRFPKYPTPQVIAQLRRETAILRGIQGRVPLEVPNPTYVQLDAESPGKTFVGYRKVPGEPLWRDTFHALRADVQDQLAMQLGRFLGALHGIPARDVVGSDLPIADTREEWRDIYHRIREKLFIYMRPTARDEVRAHFETFLDDASRWEREPVLKHGDFGPSNILFDPEQGKIKGIIDFGGAGLGDPAYDFAGLLSGYGETFVQQCTDVYPDMRTFTDRVHFYRGTFALLEALFGVENGDQAAFEAGIVSYL